MSKNRRSTRKMNVATKAVSHFGAIILVLFVVVILHILASSSCQQTTTLNGKKEVELQNLTKDLERAEQRWLQMKTPEKIDRALLGMGLLMKPPRADQNIFMKANGQPYAGQPSLAMAQRRNAGKTAMNTPARRK